jgi:hypothetical protein
MEVSGVLYDTAALPQGERAPGIHCVKGWVEPTAGLDAVENIIPAPAGNRTPVVKPAG